ncbi:hypothetical protein K4K59_002868 [Colletotrichum sp. SAR11_240]|nr:hypothetical protein K4K59_002868 [Colletotrichum sp. SAR11_240]
MADIPELPPDINRGPEILATCGSLVGISVVIVMMRMYVRAKIVRLVGWDDWCIVAATVVIFAEMMVILPEVEHGGGRHIQYIEPKENVVIGLHYNFVTQPLCLIALCLAKVSVGLFLLRVSPSTRMRATVAAVIKISFLPNYGKHGDFLFDSSDITIWTTVEICTAIIAASIPCLKPLFRAILAGSSAKYTSQYNNHDGYVRNNGTNRTGATGDPQGNIEMFSRSRRNTTAVRSGFNRSKMDSEESIVGRQESVPPDGITKTTHVSVSVDDGQQRSPKDLV